VEGKRKTSRSSVVPVVTGSALRKWRLLRKGPAYIKVSRLVRYSEADLAAFLDANRVQPAGSAR